MVDKKNEEGIDLPPGFRFHPTDEEIISHYLTKKVCNLSFTSLAMGEVDLNKCEPWDLPSKAKMGEKEWYFFCQRDRKYPTGMRTNRATELGYWKATGKDKEIYKGKGCLVGMKKTLVFYGGRAPKGEKSNWVMHEFRLDGKFSYYNMPKNAKDEWVVCRVFHKNTGIKKNPYSDPLGISSSTISDDLLASSPSLPPLIDPPNYNNPNRPSLSHTNNYNNNNKTENGIGSTKWEVSFTDGKQLHSCNPNMINQLQMNQSSNISAPNSLAHPSSYFNYGSQTILRSSQADYQAINENYDLKKQFKVEQQFTTPKNQSMISFSHDTGLSNDVNTGEISSAYDMGSNIYQEDLEGISSYDPLLDLDFLLDY